MSRTVRCKGQSIPETWLMSEKEWDDSRNKTKNIHFRKNWAHLVKDTFKETRKAELKKAHSDHGWRFFFHGNPPAAFRRDLAARRRAVWKQDLLKSVKKDDGESYLPYYPRHMKDVWWEWD